MKSSLKFGMKIPWNREGGDNKSTKLLCIITILLAIVSEYNVTLQNIPLNNDNLNNKRSVDSTTAVIKNDAIGDDAYNKLVSNCPSLDRKIYTGHSPMGFLLNGANTKNMTYQKVTTKSVTSLDDCIDECCNKQSSCESIFAFSNNSILSCFMITCQEGKYCLPSKSTKSLENSTAVVLLRPPSGVSFNKTYSLVYYRTNNTNFIISQII